MIWVKQIVIHYRRKPIEKQIRRLSGKLIDLNCLILEILMLIFFPIVLLVPQIVELLVKVTAAKVHQAHFLIILVHYRQMQIL